MKLTFAQLETHLTNSLATIYLVSGDELLLKHDAFQLIRKKAKLAGFNERTRLSDMSCDEAALFSALHATSMFADKQIIELDFTHSLPAKAASALLQKYAAEPSENNVLLIDLAKIDDKVSKSAWYKALEKSGMVVTLWPIPREQLPQWIMARAKRYKMQIAHDAAASLADLVEGNLSAAAQTLEKLYLLQADLPITTDLIKQIVHDQSRFTVFDLVETALLGEKIRVLHMIDQLHADGAEPTLLIWGLARECRLLADLAAKLKQGERLDALLQQYRIFFKRQAAFRRFLSRFTIEDCWQRLLDIAELDRVTKGAQRGNVWDSLRIFCLRLV